jgi:hypothetical protein
VPLGAGGLELMIGWAVHFMFFARRWYVEVRMPRPTKNADLRHRLDPEIWEYDGYKSKDEAKGAMRQISAEIVAGSWKPIPLQ